jgi:hypothetical protein
MNPGKRDELCIRLDSKFFELKHDHLIDAVTNISDLEIDEEDAADIKQEGFSDFWDWNDFLSKKAEIA